MALMLGSKSTRKLAGKVATYGGAAVLGGLAYKAYQAWRLDNAGSREAQPEAATAFEDQALHATPSTAPSSAFRLALVRAMVAAARADGQKVEPPVFYRA